MRCEEMRCEEAQCEEVKRAPGGVTPLVGVTWGRLGHFRGVPRGSHGEKCSLSEQKGGNEHQKGPFLDEIGQIWTKSKKFRSFITEKAIFCRQTDGRRHSKGPGVARGLVDRKYVGTARGALRAKSQLPSSCASGALGLSICDKPFPNSILLRLRRTRRPSGCALRARHARGDVPVNRRVVKI